MRKHSVTLMEITGGGWMWSEHGRSYKTLRRAYGFVNKDVKEIAKSAGVVATMIEYVPLTPAGTAEVQKLITTNTNSTQ